MTGLMTIPVQCVLHREWLLKAWQLPWQAFSPSVWSSSAASRASVPDTIHLPAFSVLEPGRTLTLAEKGGAGAEVIRAAPGFRLFATMNPGEQAVKNGKA